MMAERYLIVGAVLFVLGALGFLTRRNMIVMVLSAELMLQGVSLTFVTFGHLHHHLEGQAFTIFILTVSACEAGLALSLILALYQSSKTLDVDFWTEMRETDLPAPMIADDARAEVTEAMQFPRLTPAGHMPVIRRPGRSARVDDAGSPTADSPLEPPQTEDVIKTAEIDLREKN
jgi:NADH-quinone oxidoreductase subunit K